MSPGTGKISFFIISILFVAVVVIHFTGKNYIYKALFYNFAGIDDNKIFEERVIPGNNPFPWPFSSKYKQKLPAPTLAKLENTESVAFLVIYKDSLLYESYWDGYGNESLSNSFSVAKSIVSTLTGIALKEGKIKSLDQPVGDFLPAFREGRKSAITIRHLLTMSSGLNWDESYSNPLSMTTQAYYGDDLKELINSLEVIEPPGIKFKYLSGNTQLLAFVLQQATGKNISDYASGKLWSKIGAVKEAEWSLDKNNGTEKAYCCFYSNARDFARIGQLYLNRGIWNNDTIITPAFVEESLTFASLVNPESDSKQDFYGLSWWLIPEYKGLQIFYARGILGQYIIGVPEKSLVIVRLGKKRGKKAGMHYQDIYDYVDAALNFTE